MKLSEIYQIADTIAPVRLSHEYCEQYGAYDNSGILVDTGEEIKGITFSLDLSLGAIAMAKQTGANLIITHHPAIYGKIGNVRNADPLGKKLVECIKNGISVLCMHLNLDVAEDGIDDNLMQAVRLSSGDGSQTPVVTQHVLSEKAGYGKAYAVKPCTLRTLQTGLERELCTKRILVYGDLEKKVERVASFCGSGVDENAINFAIKNTGGKADVIISSDFKHHLISLALEAETAVMIITHYASENYGFKKYYEKIRRQVNVPCTYYTDETML